jgi:hypothetical protein
LRQPVDFFLERDDLLSRLLERRHETLVLARHGGQVGLYLLDALFEHTCLSWGFRELSAQHRDLFLQERELRLEVTNLFVVLRLTRPSIVTSGHAPSPPTEEADDLLRPYLSRAVP